MSTLPRPRSTSWLLTGLASASLGLSACAPLPKAPPGSQAVPASAYATVQQDIKEQNAGVVVTSPTLPAELRVPSFDVDQDRGSGQPALYSFKARDLPVRDALGLLAKAHGLNIVADPEVTGSVSADFKDIPLSKAFDILLSSLGYSWEDDRGVIRVRASITRTFEVDYIRAQRTQGNDGTSSFWQELEGQIRGLLSPKGRLTVNRLSGAIMVTDLPAKVEEVSRFIGLMREGMYRQVDIEVRIVEVTLNDNFKLGLDWSRMRTVGSRTESIRFDTRIGTPQAVSPLPSTMTLSLGRPGSYAALLDALREQGDVRMVSQPRVRIMNNQTASVKVGTDQPFFVRSSNRVVQDGGGVLETFNEQLRNVSVGVSMTVTPQISADGWTMLNIAPTITRLIGTQASFSKESSAPILDVSEASTMVRVRSGETVILGGLIQEESSDTNRSVPVVGEVPVFGNLFKSTYQASRRKELVIFLVPTIQPGQ